MNSFDDINAREADISQLEKKLETAIDKGNALETIQLRIQLGQLLLDEGKAPQALSHFDEAQQKAQQQGEQVLEAQVSGYRGLALRKIGNLSQALSAFQRSNEIAREVNHLPTICDSSIQGALIYAQQKEYEKAQALLERAWEIAQNRDYTKRKINIASLLGEHHFEMGNLQESIRYYRLASEAAEVQDDMHAYCTNLTNAGKVHLKWEEYQKAKDIFRKTLDKASQSGNPALEIHALEGLFLTHAQQGDIQDAAFYSDKVIDRAAVINQPQSAMEMIQSLATLYINQDRYQESLPYLDKGLAIASAEEDIYFQTRFLSILGFAQYNLGHLEDALENYQTLLKLSTEYQEQAIQALTLSRISSIYADQGKTEEALAQAQQGLALARKEGEKGLLGELQAMLAYLHRDLGDQDKALQHCEEAMGAYRAAGETAAVKALRELKKELQG